MDKYMLMNLINSKYRITKNYKPNDNRLPNPNDNRLPNDNVLMSYNDDMLWLMLINF